MNIKISFEYKDGHKGEVSSIVSEKHIDDILHIAMHHRNNIVKRYYAKFMHEDGFKNYFKARVKTLKYNRTSRLVVKIP